jgi:hypothetical protein
MDKIFIHKADNGKNGWMIFLDGKKIYGGQKGKEKLWGKEPNKTRFFFRHPNAKNSKSIRQYINAINWEKKSQIGKFIPVTKKLKSLINEYNRRNNYKK